MGHRISWGAALLIACGEDERPERAREVAQERPAQTPEPEAPAPPAEPPSSTIDLVNDTRCTITVAGEGLTARCEGGTETLACSPVGRGDLAPTHGEERIHRCDWEDMGTTVLVVSSAWTMWAELVGGGPCETPAPLEFLVVDAVADPLRELMVRQGECPEPGMITRRYERILKWRERAMEEIAAAAMQCQWTGDTTGETEVPDAHYICLSGESTALELGGTPDVPTLTEIEHVEHRLDEGVGEPATAARRALTWDAATFHFRGGVNHRNP